MVDRSAHEKKYSFKSGSVIELLKLLFFSASDRSKLVALVQSSSEDEYSGAGASDVNKSRSCGIGCLERHEEQAEGELFEFRNAKHSFGMLKQSLEGQTVSFV